MKDILKPHRKLRKIETFVENRSVYSADFAELNIYETFQKAEQVYLKFDFPIIASMISGKKIMHLEEKESFDFLPGETLVLSANKKMIIDFPEAELHKPTQCLALGIDATKIQETIDHYSHFTHIKGDELLPKDLQVSPFHINNDDNVQYLINRLMTTFISGNKAKDALLDLMIQELIVRLLQTNAKMALLNETSFLFDNNRMAFIVKYIRNHFTENISVDAMAKKACMSTSHFYKMFKNTFGETPIDYLNTQRLNKAKQLIRTTSRKLADIAHVSGFNSSSYFTRVFKLNEGMTPNQYRNSVIKV